MIAQLSPSVPLGSLGLQHRRQVGGVLLRCSGSVVFPQTSFSSVEPCGSHEDASREIVDARRQDVQRVRSHALLLAVGVLG